MENVHFGGEDKTSTKKFFGSLRFRILSVVVIAFLPAFAILFMYSVGRKMDASEAARSEAFHLAEHITDDYRQRVDEIRKMLILLSTIPEVKKKDWRACAAVFEDFLTVHPELVNIIALDAEGNVMSSAVPYQGPLNLSDRSFYQYAVRTKDFSAGEYVVGRITGKPLLPFALPLLDERAEIDYLLVASWDLEWLNELSASFSLPPGSVVMVVDERGTILARYPEGEKYVGATMPEEPVVKAMIEAEGDGSLSEKGVDGLRRLYVHRPLAADVEAGKIFVCLGFSEEWIYGPSNRALKRDLALTAVFAAFVLLLAYLLSGVFLLKPINGLQQAARELGKGDLTVRTGLAGRLGEIGILAKTFDDMAESLQMRVEERRRAEERLRESERRLSSIVTTVPVGILIFDSRGEVVFANRAALDIYGLQEQEMLHRRYDALSVMRFTLDERPLPTEEHPFRRVMHSKAGLFGLEYLAEMENGERKALSFNAVPFLGEEEEVAGVLVSVEDVTERHRSQERVKRLGQFYAVLSEVNRAIVHHKDRDSLLQEACRIMVDSGLFRMAWVGWLDPVSLRVEPLASAGDDVSYLKDVMIRADDSPLGMGPTGRAIVNGIPVVCDDIENDARVAPWRDKLLSAGFRSSGAFPLRCEGKVVGAMNVYSHLPGYFGPEEMQIMKGLTEDISFALEAMEREKRRKKAQERVGLINHCLLNLGTDPLRNMERISAVSREVLDCTLVQYWRCNGDVYQLAFHDVHSSIEGYEPSTVEMGREDFEEAFLWWRGRLQGEGKRLSRLHEIFPEVKVYGWKSMLSHPVVLGTEFVGCLCLFDRKEREFRDEEVDYAGMLTRSLAVEEERRRREEGLRDLMDIASHELRHPITVMKGYSLTLSRYTDSLSEGEKRDILRRIDQGADRLTFILEEMMDLIRIERGTLGISKSEVSASDLALAAVEEAKKKYEERTFRLLLEEETGKVIADPEKLPFALAALLDNAAKFSPPGEEVALEVRRTGGEVFFSVLDRGPGVPPGEEPWIFERFTHVGEIRYHSVPGMGLGLYIARAIVRAHDGRIWYKPREGGGSVFTIAIPAG